MLTDTLFDRFVVQCDQLRRQDETPKHVAFSSEGYRKAFAWQQHANGMVLTASDMGLPQTYGGLPYSVEPKATEELRVLSFISASGWAGTPQSEPVRLTVASADLQAGKTSLEVAGAKLSAAQLCDIIAAWCKANPRDDLQPALHKAISMFGRFE